MLICCPEEKERKDANTHDAKAAAAAARNRSQRIENSRWQAGMEQNEWNAVVDWEEILAS